MDLFDHQRLTLALVEARLAKDPRLDPYSENEVRDLIAERDMLLGVLERGGFRRCDVPACNCGSWHMVTP